MTQPGKIEFLAFIFPHTMVVGISTTGESPARLPGLCQKADIEDYKLIIILPF